MMQLQFKIVLHGIKIVVLTLPRNNDMGSWSMLKFHPQSLMYGDWSGHSFIVCLATYCHPAFLLVGCSDVYSRSCSSALYKWQQAIVETSCSSKRCRIPKSVNKFSICFASVYHQRESLQASCWENIDCYLNFEGSRVVVRFFLVSGFRLWFAVGLPKWQDYSTEA